MNRRQNRESVTGTLALVKPQLHIHDIGPPLSYDSPRFIKL